MTLCAATPPLPTADDAPFWQACRERRLVFQVCDACAAARHPPGPRCPACVSAAFHWQEPSGVSRLWSWTVASGPEPFVIALVVFDAMPGVRLISNILDADPSVLVIGQELALEWQAHPEAGFLPRFRLSDSPAASNPPAQG